MQNTDPLSEQPTPAGKDDIKFYFNKIISNWYLFVLSIFICLLFTFVYVKFARREYRIKSKILVKDEKSNSSSATKGLADLDISSLLGTTNSTEAEVEILNSRALMTSVANKLHLNIVTGMKGKVRAVETIDRYIPFEPQMVAQVDSIEPRRYTLDHLTAQSFHIVNSNEGIDEVGTFGKPLKLPQYTLLLNFKQRYILPPKIAYEISIQSVDSKVEELMNAFDVQLSSKQSPVIDLTLSYPVPQKGEEILRTLMELYLKQNLEDKVKIADSTLSFIDAQLQGVTRDLGGIENQIENFKTRNELADINEQSKALIGNASDYFKKLNDIEVQLALADNLYQYINNPANRHIIPSSFTVNDPVFAAAIDSYNQLIASRDRQSMSYGEDHPIIVNLDQQIERARQSLVKSFNEYRKTLDISKRELVNRNSTINNQIKGVPAKERVFLDYSRQQEVKQQLYVYLLEKREETAISKTSTFSSSEVIDPAKSDSLPYAPKGMVIYLSGLIIGIILPILYLSLKEGLNTRVTTKSDITSATRVSIIGEISHGQKEKTLRINKESRSLISEQFRTLRANLKYVAKSDKSQVIMITSSMSGEGKSFTSFNLASIMALNGKKVVLLEFDLRKPKLSASMGIDNDYGFTNWVISDSFDVKKILKPIPQYTNAYIIPSGPVPPNPAELLDDLKLEIMFSELRRLFDFIIIDTAPIGLVSDALLVEKFADVCLFIVRQGYTFKSQLDIVNDLTESGKVRKMYLVVNDINQEKRGGYYGYGYNGYAYGYGEYVGHSRNDDSIFSRFIKN